MIDFRNRIFEGDAAECLRRLPDGCAQCCVTSPPYWSLRDYGCEGQIGQERTPNEYVERIVEVFREVRRVLRDDGTLWLNLGDTYAGHWGKKYAHKPFGKDRSPDASTPPNKPSLDFRNSKALKPKDLIGIPWRVALALQAEGWWLRSDIVWNKTRPLPESVTDRPTKSHEFVFLLTKSKRYFYDAFAVREPCKSGPFDIRKMVEGRDRIGGKHKTLQDPLSKASASTRIGRKRSVGSPAGRNLRTVWEIAPQSFKGAHFATFPERLVSICIRAGTSSAGACARCGAPWRRVVDLQPVTSRSGPEAHRHESPTTDSLTGTTLKAPAQNTTGWLPTCSCMPVEKPQAEVRNAKPCVVIDPFMGSGTVAKVARELGRDFWGCDINPKYVDMAYRRAGLPMSGKKGDTPLFESRGAKA